MAVVSEKYEIADVFNLSRDHGLEPQNLAAIAKEWAPKLNLTDADVHTYLIENIHYYLDAANSEGLDLFYRYAAELKLIPEAPALRMLGNSAFKLYR